MGIGRGIIGCMMVLMIVGATAETFNVGDDLNWNIPPLGNVAYRTWAATKEFEFGDTIVFNWSGTHTVARVSREEYDNCTSTNTIGPIQTTSPASFTLDTNGTHYYICTVDRHCGAGQKVAITVGTSASSRTTTAALSAIVLAIAISMLSLM
ncbi:hypothetical protein LguiA_019835 [Lonicera macranthoides]